jgi:metallophosphoesterase (TIGR00282 family)
MKILYIGDIMGEPGITAVQKCLPGVRELHRPDLVIAQAENVSQGRGMTVADMGRLQSIGVEAFTGGNWSLHRKELHKLLENPDEPVVRPANYPDPTPGKKYKILQTNRGPVLLVSLLGQIVGKDADNPMDNPLQCIDSVLENTKHVKFAARIINFHGDYSSEKRVIGYYLDGRATAVVGDHWHVPTADALVLPKGTAHITDVGMCGTLHSSLGVKLDTIINRWRNATVSKNELETEGPLQFNAVLVEVSSSGLAETMKQIQLVC